MPIMFAAFEIAAAEAAAAAAAEVAAAEAAAAAAAEVAAAEAASTAAAQAATQAAAQQATTTGIMEVGGATANAPLTAEAVQNAAMNSGLPPGFEQQLQNVQNLGQGPSVQVASANPTAGLESLQNVAPNNFLPYSFESSLVPAEASAINTSGGIASPTLAAPPPSPPMGLEMPGAYSPGNIQGADPNFFNPSATVAPGQGPLPTQYQLNAPNASQGLRLGGTGLEGIPPSGPMTSVLQPPSALEAGMDKAIKFAEKNPFTAMTGAYMGASALGLLNPSGATFNNTPYDGPLSKYKLSPNFQAGNANPANFQYNPATNRRYAGGGILDSMGGGGSGGISANGNLDLHIPIGFGNNNNNVGGYQSVGASNMSPSPTNNFAPQQTLGANNDINVGGNESIPGYARGGSLSDSIESYQKMLGGQPQAAPTKSPDVGIYYDQDPDTRYQDALTAAQIRQAKVNKRANMQLPGPKRPTPMGQLNLKPIGSAATASESTLDPETAKHGGIMHSSLGGYAAGGNPRLLKGPGDGMSDNIPATINGRQPARLADGEFVIPADVVSHLGNGSTEAGAKHLHAMMNKVRKARTGNPKQGKQIKPQKYMPR